MSTRAETETVIVFNDEDEYATVDTMHGRVKRACEQVIHRMGRGREGKQNHGIRDGRKVRWEFKIPKEAIAVPRVPKRRELTQEQRASLAERGRTALARNRAQAVQVLAPDGSSKGSRQGEARQAKGRS
jgi:hypothetical protein